MSIHLDNWLKRVNVDFYMMFIQSWIPFNAWYNKNFYDEEKKRTSDRDLIDYIKNSDNQYKSRIINLLRNNSTEADSFRKLIADLHYELEAHSIPNQENKIAFSNISISKNSETEKSVTYSRRIYAFKYKKNEPRTSKRYVCTILKSNPARTTEDIIELHSCRKDEIEQHPTYNIKSSAIQRILLEGFNDINPNKTINIVSPKRTDIRIADSLFFINNEQLVSHAIIELIYQLRCKIFHGEVDPNANSSKIYEYAYLIQKQLVESLK